MSNIPFRFPWITTHIELYVPNCKGERGEGVKLQVFGEKSSPPSFQEILMMIFPLVHYIRCPSSTIRYERLAMLLVVFFLKKWNQRKTLRRRLHAWVVSSYRNNFRHQFVIQIKPFKLALFVIYFQKRILWAKFKTPVLLYLSTKMVKTFLQLSNFRLVRLEILHSASPNK